MLNENTASQNPNAFQGSQYTQQSNPKNTSSQDELMRSKQAEKAALIRIINQMKLDSNLTPDQTKEIEDMLEKIGNIDSDLSIASRAPDKKVESSQYKSPNQEVNQMASSKPKYDSALMDKFLNDARLNASQQNQQQLTQQQAQQQLRAQTQQQSNAQSKSQPKDIKATDNVKDMQEEAEKLRQYHLKSISEKSKQMLDMQEELNKILANNTSPKLTADGAAKQMRDTAKYQIANENKLATKQAALFNAAAQKADINEKPKSDVGLANKNDSKAPISSKLQYSVPQPAQTKDAESPPPSTTATTSTQTTAKPKNDALIDDIAKANFLAKTIDEDTRSLGATNKVNCILEGNAQKLKAKDAAGLYSFFSSFHSISSTVDPKDNVTVDGQTYNMETLYAIDPKTNMSVWNGLPLKTKEKIACEYEILADKARKRSALYSGLFKVASAALGITSIVLMFVPGGQIAGAALMGATFAVHVAKAAFTAVKVKKAADAMKNSDSFQTMQRESAAQNMALSKNKSALKEVLTEANGTITDERRNEIEESVSKSTEEMKSQGKYNEKAASISSGGVLNGIKEIFSPSSKPKDVQQTKEPEIKLRFGPNEKPRTEEEKKDILELIQKTRKEAGVFGKNELSKEGKMELSEKIKSLSEQHNAARAEKGQELLYEPSDSTQDPSKSQTQGSFADKEKKKMLEVTERTEYVR